MKLRKVVGYDSGYNKEGKPYVYVKLECGHEKPLPRGIYDENTMRMCKECK